MVQLLPKQLNVICMLFIAACNSAPSTSTFVKTDLTTIDTLSHGYNELANTAKYKSFCISDYNTDNPNVANIRRPEASFIETTLDTNLLFGIWTLNPEGPHADFKLTSKSFFVVDYDGDGDMPYELNGQKLRIYYNDFIQEGQIVSVSKDTLQVIWKGVDITTHYIHWPENSN